MTGDAEDHHSMEEAPLEAVLEEALEHADNGEVRLRAVLKALDDRSYGPLFILFGFVAGTPLAVVPGAAAVVGVVITLLAVQMVFGNAHPWLPGAVLDRKISEESLRETRQKIEPTLIFLDRLITERWRWASNEILRRIAAAIVAVLGLAMIPFDAIPFAVAAPAWTVVLFGVAITARDGLVMLIAVGACLLVGWLGAAVI